MITADTILALKEARQKTAAAGYLDGYLEKDAGLLDSIKKHAEGLRKRTLEHFERRWNAPGAFTKKPKIGTQGGQQLSHKKILEKYRQQQLLHNEGKRKGWDRWRRPPVRVFDHPGMAADYDELE
jgi:hypothetical protein